MSISRRISTDTKTRSIDGILKPLRLADKWKPGKTRLQIPVEHDDEEPKQIIPNLHAYMVPARYRRKKTEPTAAKVAAPRAAKRPPIYQYSKISLPDRTSPPAESAVGERIITAKSKMVSLGAWISNEWLNAVESAQRLMPDFGTRYSHSQGAVSGYRNRLKIWGKVSGVAAVMVLLVATWKINPIFDGSSAEQNKVQPVFSKSENKNDPGQTSPASDDGAAQSGADGSAPGTLQPRNTSTSPKATSPTAQTASPSITESVVGGRGGDPGVTPVSPSSPAPAPTPAPTTPIDGVLDGVSPLLP